MPDFFRPEKLQELETCMGPFTDSSLLPHSRIHAFEAKSFGLEPCFLLREDEAGPLAPGGKMRKYASLLPWLQDQGKKEVIVSGSASGNNTAALPLYIRQHKMQPRLVVKSGNAPFTGNQFISALGMNPEEILSLPAEDWPAHEELARAKWPEAIFIEEGAACPASGPGALSLMADILHQGTRFEEIWIDAGTGYSAACLAAGLQFVHCPVHLKIVSMAENPDVLRQSMEGFVTELGSYLRLPLKLTPHLEILRPATAKSFGSVNRTLLEFVRDFTRTTGIWVDPIYSGKFFHTVMEELGRRKTSDPMLLIHSGGFSGLMGFAEKMEALLR